MSAAGAIVRTELALRRRSPGLLLLLVFLLAACALLVPDPQAGYAVLTVDRQKPAMSAETALVAAGVVLGLLLLPVYALALDIGHARDRESGLDRLQLTSPVGGAVLYAARLAAALVFVLLTSGLSLLVVLSTVGARYGSLPGPAAMVLFLLLVVPSGMAAALIAAVLDRLLPGRNTARTGLAFALWMGLTLAAVAGPLDLFGFGYLKQVVAAGDDAAAFAIGIVAAPDLPSFPWSHAPLTGAFAARRGAWLALLPLVGAVLALGLRPRPEAAGERRSSAPTAPPQTPRAVCRPTLDAPLVARASTTHVVARLVAGWMKRSRFVALAAGATLLLAVVPGTPPGAALVVALTIPLSVAARTSIREQRVAATLEQTTAALQRPTPSLLYGWVLALLALAPGLPALGRMPMLQALTALSGVLATTFWLTWSHRCVRRPLLGIATVAVVWYCDAFNELPAALDVLGLWHADPVALSITAPVAAAALLLVARSDSLGSRGVHVRALPTRGAQR